MLNDLLSVERGLTAFGMTSAGRHPDIKDMAKGWAFRVRMAEAGRIASVEIVAEAGQGAVWTLRDGQHNGFPGLKTAAGLLSLDADARDAHQQVWSKDKTATGRSKAVLDLLDFHSVDLAQMARWPSAGHRQRIGERLEALRPLAGGPLTAAVPAAFERFLAALEASPPFLEQLTAVLAEHVREGRQGWLDPVRAAFTGPIALAIDVPDMEFQRDAGDPRQIDAVSSALSGPSPAQERASQAGSEAGPACALSGKRAPLHTGNFPQPNLPGLGQTYIFSRNRDIPSLARYGRAADASFPVDADLVRRLSGAVTALSRQDAKGKTWRLIPAESGDAQDLLLVSTADPGSRLADAVAEEDDRYGEEVGGEAALDQLGSRVIDESEGVSAHGHPQGGVTILILRTVDPANRKAIYHRETTAAAFWTAAKRWQAARSNTPDWLAFLVPVKGKSEAVMRGPPRVTPLSITPLSRIHFANGGRRRVDVIGVGSQDAFGLFLHEGDVEARARRLLRLLVRRHGALLGGLAAARTKGIEHLRDFDPKTDLRRDALRSVAWLGILLHHLGHDIARTPDMPERIPYGEDIGFRLGQFLAVADVVHVGYCQDMRGGDVPPTLIGNSVLSIAGSDPARALAILLARMKPYLGWAKRADAIFTKAAAEEARGNKARARALRQGVSQARRAKDIATDVYERLEPYRSKGRVTDDAFKAELLLGYVAGLPPAAGPTGSTSTTDSDASGNGDKAEDHS